MARALGELKLIDDAFATGKLSYAKVRAITRVATPETEQNFIDVAMHATAAQIEFRNTYGLKLHPTPDRGADLDELDHWLHTDDPDDPDLHHRGTPLWDGSPLDLEYAVNSMLAVELACTP